MNLRVLSRKRIAAIALLGTLILVTYYATQAKMSFASPASPGNTYFPLISNGKAFYISPTGNDNNSGTSAAAPWATFDRAWQSLAPGDTLILMDGIYYQSVHPQHVGEIGKPVTLRAQNDGQAIIDGEGERIPIHIEAYRQSYLVIEGIIARDGIDNAIAISGDHNVLRRVSAYDGNTDGNSYAIGIGGNYNLLEDCIAGGTGRKMILIYRAEHNIIRRCFTDWQQWDGKETCIDWPWGENINIYNASNNIVENSIGYGSVPGRSISIISNHDVAVSSGNKILGSIAIDAGMNHDGTIKTWGDTRPQPTQCTQMRNFDWPGQRSGFQLYGQGIKENNLFQDIFAWRNAGLGFSNYRPFGPAPVNCQIIRATIYNNGLDAPSVDGGIGSDVKPEQLAECSVVNSYIEGTAYQGEGARLTNRYVNGVLTNEPLWPWPMEDRGLAELGYSITDVVTSVISSAP